MLFIKVFYPTSASNIWIILSATSLVSPSLESVFTK